MVSIAALIMAPVLLGSLIYGATVIFPKHPVSPARKDINNATDLLNTTIHTASEEEEDDEDEEEEEEAAAGKVSAPRPNHSEGRRRVSKLETIHEQDETDQQIETLGTELQGIVSNVLDSDEAVQFADVFEGLTQDSLTLSSPANPSCFDILPVIMALPKPIVLNLRADIRNTLIWLCQGEPGSMIDGKAAVDKAAKQVLLADQTVVVYPNGTVYFMDLFDPNLGKIVLDCLQGHSTLARCSRV
ncbi:hypothetical protein BG006_008975 [Podila minutissima]|uniref:Uncharacterized protein n=1 Tax=Podila minutissima TaxID=64525 RepID=A0A9P5VPS9_9FUNG|nr:hypothetical protein BG006_008975 [Podila minutissima]